MDGVLIDDKVFVPMSSILEINMEDKTIRLNIVTTAGPMWRTFTKCEAVLLDPGRSLTRFHDWHQ